MYKSNAYFDLLCTYVGTTYSGVRYHSRDSTEIGSVLQIIYYKAFNLFQNNVDTKMMLPLIPIPLLVDVV